MSLAERLRLLVQHEGKQKKLAEKINATPQSISQTITHDRSLSGDTIIAIAEAYPQLNMRWFLTGQGESGLDGVVLEVKPEDPEKELLKEELLNLYKQRVQDLEREIREYAPILAKKLKI